MTLSKIMLAVAIVTAYALGDGYTPSDTTASGEPPIAGWTIAADTDHHPMGTLLWIEGVGVRKVMDRGSAIQGADRFDVYMSSVDDALQWGRREVRYQVVEPYGLSVWYRDRLAARCSYTPMADGAYTARHCLEQIHGPAWTVYAGHYRVTAFSLDPVRDLAHVVIPGTAQAMRAPGPGEVGHIPGADVQYQEQRRACLTNNGIAQSCGSFQHWCTVSGPGAFPGYSGIGIYADDGSALGVVSGAGPIAQLCGGRQSIWATSIP